MLHILSTRWVRFIFFFVLVSQTSYSVAQELDFDGLVKRDWITVSSANFVIVTDLRSKRAHLMTEQLEQFATFCSLFLRSSHGEKSAKTQLFVAANASTWEKMGLDSNLVALHSSFEQRAPMALINLDSGFGGGFKRPSPARADLFKVIAAQQMYETGAALELPLWYVQGMSLYLSTYSEKKSKILLGDIQALSGRLSKLFNAGGGIRSYESSELINLKTLPKRDTFATDERYVGAMNELYARAFMTVHLFQSSKEYQERLNRYLDILKYGDTPEGALDKAFGWSFDDLDRELVRYSRGNLYARAFDQDQLLRLIDQANPNLRASIKLTEVAPLVAMETYAQYLEQFALGSIADEEKRAFIDRVSANRASSDQEP